MTIAATNVPIEGGIEIAAHLLQLYVASGDVAFGWHDKSVGVKVKMGADQYWLRIHRQPLDASRSKTWRGIQEAAVIQGVCKPQFIQTVEWSRYGWRWRADLMTYVKARPCSSTPELTHRLSLTDRWWAELRRSLQSVSATATARKNTRHEYFSRRIGERFGYNVDTGVQTWTTAHGDIHWANLTRPDLSILDWEVWGTAPFGLDVAFLKCFSLLRPEVVGQVERTFGDWLATRDGKLCQLFAVAELLRMVEIHGDHPALRLPLLWLGLRTRGDLLTNTDDVE